MSDAALAASLIAVSRMTATARRVPMPLMAGRILRSCLVVSSTCTGHRSLPLAGRDWSGAC